MIVALVTFLLFCLRDLITPPFFPMPSSVSGRIINGSIAIQNTAELGRGAAVVARQSTRRGEFSVAAVNSACLTQKVVASCSGFVSGQHRDENLQPTPARECLSSKIPSVRDVTEQAYHRRLPTHLDSPVATS
jgi:hypothetical protein